MATATTAVPPIQPKQNWLVDPKADWLFIIATPILALIWAVPFSQAFGLTALMSVFLVFNVGHHLPTFIRIYGDKDLLRRFRWRLILGPIVPFSLAMGVVVYLIQSGLNLFGFVCLIMVLTLWDPWHFLMQHYGFMRIYDRPNAAPVKLAAWMDFSVCTTWFVYIMIAAGEWSAGILYDLKVMHSIPLLDLFQPGVYPFLRSMSLAAAVVATIVYGGYLLWCLRRGFFISHAKLSLLLITFGIMYLTYTRNAAIHRVHPDWTFQHGFATLGMVHVTQYLAIVWKFNRSLSFKPERSRGSAFRKFFGRGGLSVATAYVLLCLLYGFILTTVNIVPDALNPLSASSVVWIVGFLLACGFTSTFLHYYYDGFIWKVRHKENRENLAMQGGTKTDAHVPSWWEQSVTLTAGKTLAKHALYFAPPMLFLAISFILVQKTNEKTTQPLRHAWRAIEFFKEGRVDESIRVANEALPKIENQLDLEQKAIGIHPAAKHYTYVADLIYLKARLKYQVIGGLHIPAKSPQCREELRRAIAAAEKALQFPSAYGHAEQQELTREQLERTVAQMRREISAKPMPQVTNVRSQ